MAESTEKKIRKFFEVGTIEGMILGVVLAIVVWLLLIWQGFWKTLLFAALVLLFLFIFGVKDKQAFISRIARMFAPQGGHPGLNREALTQKVREAVKQPEMAAEAFDDEAEEVAEDLSAAEEAAEAVEEAAEEAAETTEEAVAEAVEDTTDKVKKAAEEAASETAEAIEDAAAEAAEDLKE